MLGRGIRSDDIPAGFDDLYPDLSLTHWAFAEIIEASVAHTYTRKPDGWELWATG